MSDYKPIDSKREEFRKYLDREGVMDALTKVLVNLYELVDKPDNALDYVKKNLGGTDKYDIDEIRADLEKAHDRIKALTAELNALKGVECEEEDIGEEDQKDVQPEPELIPKERVSEVPTK